MKYKVDELGRITIPIEFRKKLGIKTGEKVEISIDNGVIKVRQCSDKSYDDLIKENEFLIKRENKLQVVEQWVNNTLNKYEELLKEETNQDVITLLNNRIEILKLIEEIGE